MPKHPPPTPGFGVIPPGWDFPEARKAADEGCDLWAVDILQKLNPSERLLIGMSASRLIAVLRKAGQHELATFVRIL